jgi:zinc protease
MRFYKTLIALTLITLAVGHSTLAQKEMTRVNYRERTLENGLKVYSVEDHSSPTVAIQVWYHVGGKDDPAGRSGFAHLFEHIMFKSTKNMKSEMMDRLTEDVGGENNAFTAEDVTVYHETVPSNYLESLIWAEADRLASLNVDSANFQSERAVVEEEFRQSILAPPYGRLGLLIEDKSFTKHPYRRSVIGRIEDLDAATLEDVRGFHATYYRPDNAALIIAGDFDQKQLDSWVDKYFGRVPKPASVLPRVDTKEPARTRENVFTEYVANVPLPAVAVTYLVPPARSADSFALRIADTILSGGTSSRLYQALVYQQQVAQEASSSAELREDAGLFTFNVTLASGKKPEAGEHALLEEIRRMASGPVSAAEMDKAKNQLVTAQLRRLETNAGKAETLGRAVVLLGDPGRINTDIERLQAVSAADVQRVMQEYFTDNNRVVIYYLPDSMKPSPTSTSKALMPSPQHSLP